ncbi:SDR family oxidoreductase [Streptomyces sp. NPDC001663]|uniref:SDR family oxidoreductase n=1 Tax=Streptomyces sp. NPDC001663 TaxID=3364597 RepID=UPI0036C1AB67
MAVEDAGLPVALVTGANRGIGYEVVRQLADRRHRVVLGARDLANGQAAAARIDPGGDRVTAVELDVSDEASVTAMAEWVTRTLGRVDVVVNNAAILYDTWAQARSADLGEVQRALDTNLFGAWRVTQSLLPLLQRSPHPRVVMVSSEGGSLHSMSGGTPAYSVSKAALNALTRLLAGELSGQRILVNAICPGWVATDMGGPGGRPVDQGAAGIVWAATLPDDGPTGGFYRDGEPVPW